MKTIIFWTLAVCALIACAGLSKAEDDAQSDGMKTVTTKKPEDAQNRRASHAATASRQRKPSKRTIAEAWAKASGIVNTGETDLSTREGFGD